MQVDENSQGLRIAFGCQARVGKDTAVGYLLKKYGGTHLKFAKPIYEILIFAQEKCGFQKVKDRKFLQWIGTEWARAQDPDIWCKMLISEVEKLPKETNIFISDLRFPNEFQYLREAGFTLIKIERDNSTLLDAKVKKHTSETSLDQEKNWDYRIYNNSSIVEFYRKLDSTISYLNPSL